MRGGEPVLDPSGQADHTRDMRFSGSVDVGAHTADRDIGGTWIRAYCITAFSLLAQWGGTLFAGPGRRRELTLRSSKRMALLNGLQDSS